MKFLIDARSPRRLAGWLTQAGHDALHTLDLPDGNRTPDAELITRAVQESRIVMTKDDDFVQSYLLTGNPPRLLLISTGNIANADLEILIRAHLTRIESVFVEHRFVELGRNALVIHE